MRYFPILIFALFVHVEAQPTPCPAQSAKAPIPSGATTQSPNRAAMAAAMSSPDMAAKKLEFAEILAKRDADPSVKALGKKNQELINAAVNGPEHSKQRVQMAAQVAASQSSSAYRNQKAAFVASLKCIAP